MNTFSAVGRITKDLDLKYTQNGLANLRFNIAVRRAFKNGKTGEFESDFINCVAWRGTAEFMANNLVKGNRIAITGRIETGSYEGQDGKRIYTTDVVVDNVTPIDFGYQDGQKQQQQQGGFGGQANQQQQDQQQQQQYTQHIQQQQVQQAQKQYQQVQQQYQQQAQQQEQMQARQQFSAPVNVNDDDLPF